MRSQGIDADIDLFHLDEPIDWTRFGSRGIDSCDFTLVAISPAWAERWSGDNRPGEGAGAANEADTLRGLFARDQDAWQRRVILVMLPGIDSSVVPLDLQRANRVTVDPADPDSIAPLIRLITSQPSYPKPPLGAIPILTPKREQPTSKSGKKVSAETDLKRLQKLLEGNLSSQRTRGIDPESKAQLEAREAILRGFIDAALRDD